MAVKQPTENNLRDTYRDHSFMLIRRKTEKGFDFLILSRDRCLSSFKGTSSS